MSQAVRLLRGGKLLAYPTESVFGIGCSPENKCAVEKLLALKNRQNSKAFLLVAATISQIERYIDRRRIPESTIQEVFDSWPGPYTWVFPASKNVPKWLTGGMSGIGLRVSAHPPVISLCKSYGGAIVSTSANPQGQMPAKTLTEVIDYFDEQIDGILNASIGHHERPTIIRNAISGEIIRV